MDKTKTQAIQDKLAEARALVDTPEVARLTQERNKAAARVDELKTIEASTPLSSPQLLELADARRRMKQANGSLEALARDIAKHRQEVDHLQALLNAPAALAKARKQWSVVAQEQIKATRAAAIARDELDRLHALLVDEEAKRKSAQETQRAAALADLGFGDKPATAADAVKTLAEADSRIDALKTAIPLAETRVTQTDDALLKCNDTTREAERAIVLAKAHAAELAHAIALEEYRATLREMHGAVLAATGVDGQRVNLYDEHSRATFEAVAQRIKAEAEQGE